MANIRIFNFLPAICLAMLCVPAVWAQQPLPVATGAAWTHIHSGITIPATLDELARMRATSFAEPQLDISQNFGSSDGQQQLTLYIFRNTNGSVPLWFAQAQRAISLRADLKNPALALPPTVFTPPGRATGSGLKAVFAPSGVEGIRSTGVALFAVGDWYVKLRATSATLGPEELSAWMETALAGIRFPRTDPVAAVQPIADCGDRLNFTPDAVDSTLAPALLTAGVQAPATRMTPARWCFDHVVAGNQALYRPADTRDRYLLARGDNGKAFAVQPQAPGGYYSVNFITASQSFRLPAQDRLPSPQRVLALADGDRPAGVTATWPPR